MLDREAGMPWKQNPLPHTKVISKLEADTKLGTSLFSLEKDHAENPIWVLKTSVDITARKGAGTPISRNP